MRRAAAAPVEAKRWTRRPSRFREWVTADGSSGFQAEPGRYHLYVARACPWSHRTLIVRELKALHDVVGISYAAPYRDERGWAFGQEDVAGRGTDANTKAHAPGPTQAGDGFVDELNGWEYLSSAYLATDLGYEGRVSVPVLWDTETGRIVNNESADIVRMFNAAFDEWGDATVDLYPEPLRAEIDELNAWIYEDVNNGAYRAGFARTQEDYDVAFADVFAALARLEGILAERRYLTGDALTEADWRLWPTLVRFDPVYHTHFRLNGRRVSDHYNLWGYTRELYQRPGIAATTSLREIREHYYTTHDQLNPKHLIPRGPLDWDLDAPHGRG